MALSDGLVGYWSPWLGSSGYRLLDRTRYANHGTLFNMDAGTDWVGATIQGRSGYALDFDGTNDYVEIPHRDSLNLLSDLSISMWVYPKSSAAGNKILIAKNSASASTFELYLKGLVLYWYVGGAEQSSGLTVEVNKWSHVAAIRTGSTLRFLLNFSMQSTISISAPPSLTAPVQIGRDSNGQYFPGSIADISLYNRSIGLPEMFQLYNIGPGWYRPYAKRSIGYQIAGFKAYWNRRQQQVIGGGLR